MSGSRKPVLGVYGPPGSSFPVYASVRHDAGTLAAWMEWPLKSKECPDCGRDLPSWCFYAKTRWPCGVTRTWGTYCIECSRERTRFAARQRRRRAGVQKRPGNPYRIRGGHWQSGYGDIVASEPFVQWINSMTNEYTITDLARAADVDPERLRRIANGHQRNVTIGFVDRVMIASGTSVGLWELYD